ncbi:helix-turn-helix transcriptional regulator [Patulibacter minatonensis]|uniref:helix-turn-helix transcriptional regulator n=1 Tax=Patulibacter minatonensis TaxID=298163 RepID=UPI00047BC05D|nr:helix-turn-helix transcriptional regulator [Patulibacter minatonensis]
MSRQADRATALDDHRHATAPRISNRSHASLLRSARILERRLREVQDQLEALTAQVADASVAPAPDAFPAPPRLTAAEHRVLALLPSTLSRGQIAMKLHLSPNTVKTHVQRIYRCLDVSTREDAVTAGRAHGYL